MCGAVMLSLITTHVMYCAVRSPCMSSVAWGLWREGNDTRRKRSPHRLLCEDGCRFKGIINDIVRSGRGCASKGCGGTWRLWEWEALADLWLLHTRGTEQRTQIHTHLSISVLDCRYVVLTKGAFDESQHQRALAYTASAKHDHSARRKIAAYREAGKVRDNCFIQ